MVISMLCFIFFFPTFLVCVAFYVLTSTVYKLFHLMANVSSDFMFL